MKYNHTDTAVVVIDPQIDVLIPSGISWDVLGASVVENRTVEHLATTRRIGRGVLKGALGDVLATVDRISADFMGRGA